MASIELFTFFLVSSRLLGACWAPNQIFADSAMIGTDDADSLEQLLVWSALMSCERAGKHMSHGTLIIVINLAYRGN